MKISVLHGKKPEAMEEEFKEDKAFLTITTYGMVSRIKGLREKKWDCVVLDDRPEGYMKLKAMVSPFMLRRLKTDKTVISDLPEKLERVDYVPLKKRFHGRCFWRERIRTARRDTCGKAQ